MQRSELSETDIDNLLHSTKWAVADFEWPKVRNLTTRLLEEEDLPPQTTVAMLRQRAVALEYMGYMHEAADDLHTAVSLADSAALVRQKIKARTHLSFVTSVFMRDFDSGLQFAQEALDLALQLGDVRLEADGRMEVSRSYMMQGRFAEQEQEAERILKLARECDYPRAEAGGCYSLATIAIHHYDDEQRAMILFQQALQKYRESGDWEGVMIIHLVAGALTSSLSLTRYHFEQLLQIAREIGHVQRQITAGNSLAFVNWKLTLYHRAKEMIEQAILASQKSGLPPNTDFQDTLQTTLAECYWVLGDYEQLQPLLDEKLEATKNHKEINGYEFFLSGLAALGEGDHRKAIRQLQTAVEHAYDSFGGGAPAAALAWLGAAELADGQIEQAVEHTSQAVSLPETRPVYTPQEIWWWHYRASLEWRAASGEMRVTSKEDPLPDELFAILDRARRLMMDFVIGISDEGLRRNYLNKVAINRDITLEWTRRAAERGESLAPFTEREMESGSFEEQFKRLVEIGNRLTAERDRRTLPDTIRNEFVELSGAERAIVALRDEEGELFWAATVGIREDEREEATAFITPFLEKVRDIRAPVLREREGAVPEGDVPELHLRSAIALPLVSQGRLWGMLYGDMRHIFGRFNQRDLSLLNLLANQAAAALENADWVEGLEEQVKERTAELQTANADLEERNAELAIINSIQAGLVEEMDIQAIYDLIGFKLVEFFPEANSVGISTIDADLKVNHNIFVYEKGKRFYFDPLSYAGAANEKFLDFLVNRKDVLLVNENADDFLASFGVVQPLEGTEASKSSVMVPMIVIDQVRGHVVLEDTDREHAFSDADVRLLTTITNAMSMALENARLFNETQSLYIEAQEAKQQAEEARQTAEEANQAKSSFLSSMSHELRTPLNAIIGFTRIVKRKARGSLPEKQIDNLGKVLASAEHLLGLINSVLDLAKIEAGRMDVLPSEYGVEALVEMCLATAQPLARPRVEMVASVPLDLPPAYSDQDKIRQILLNTLSNAAKFTHEGSITLQVQQQDGLLIYEVIDTGIGMNEEQLTRVFEEFQQAENTTSRDYGGTGLGLPISKQLAQLLGGDLVAATIAGEGTTFTLSIPMRLD